MTLIPAANFVHPSGSILQSGLSAAVAILDRLREGDAVTVDLSGLKGLPSSYFNAILQSVKADEGLGVVGTRLIFKFDSPAQELVFKRSLAAVEAESPAPTR